MPLNGDFELGPRSIAAALATEKENRRTWFVAILFGSIGALVGGGLYSGLTGAKGLFHGLVLNREFAYGAMWGAVIFGSVARGWWHGKYVVPCRTGYVYATWEDWLEQRPDLGSYKRQCDAGQVKCIHCGGGSIKMIAKGAAYESDSQNRYWHYRSHICGLCGTELWRSRGAE